MSTRGLVLVQVDREIKAAQAVNYDSYPAGLGLYIKDFVSETMRHYGDIYDIKNCFRNCEFISQDEIEKIQDSEGNAFEEKYPQLATSMPDILNYIVDKRGCVLSNDEQFAQNSMQCDWAYLVNLDIDMVEFYRGSNREPLAETDRFYKYMEASIQEHKENMAVFKKHYGVDPEQDPVLMKLIGKPYYPIKMIFEIPFEKLAKMTNKAFLDTFKPYEEE